VTIMMMKAPHPIVLEWTPGNFAVCRLHAAAAVPEWASDQGALLSITRTATELSIVLEDSKLPVRPVEGLKVERDWLALAIAGTVDFNLIGILSRLTGALAAAEVPVFVISTFDTDILMFRSRFRERAIAALSTVAKVPAH
jgi:uncharacterized protein